ncbi:MAG: ribosome silencing factor [Gemmatimonadota bacterium]
MAHRRTPAAERSPTPESRSGSARGAGPSPAALADLAAHAIEDLKGNQLSVLDLRGLNDATDYFVIASGTSDAHVRGLADTVMERLGRRGVHPHHVEGLPTGRWVLLDYVEFVVHLFHPEFRAFYQLERLWSDAPVVRSSTPPSGPP